MSSLALIVGLGNPGEEYARTRHNVGFMALAELTARDSGGVAFKKKFDGEFAKGTLGGRECILVRPGTYMNESGRSVGPAASFFAVPPADVIVLHDELDLPFGDVRIKQGGGHAGHNGLRSIIDHLGSADFIRVRVGIGRPSADFAGEVSRYVLSGFAPAERAALGGVIERAASAVIQILSNGFERTMNETNRRSLREAAAKDGPGGVSGPSTEIKAAAG